MQRISFFLFFLLSGFGILHAQNRTSTRINEGRLDGFAETTFQAMRFYVGRMPYYTGINVYADRGLTKAYAMQELTTLFSSCETVTIPDPYDPDDPYKLIDTILCTPFDPYSITGWVLYAGKNKFLRNQWKEVASIRAGKYPERTDGALPYYYKAADVNKYLTDGEKRLLNAFIAFDDPHARNSDSVVVSDSLLKRFIAAWYDSVSTSLYRSINKGTVTLYNSDSLKYELTLAELDELGGYCETAQYPNPANPNDPYDLIDSTVCTPFDPAKFTGFGMGYEWKLAPFNSQARLRTISLLFKQSIVEIELPERPMFYIKAEDVKKLLPETDWLLMNDIFNYGVLSTIDKQYYWR